MMVKALTLVFGQYREFVEGLRDTQRVLVCLAGVAIIYLLLVLIIGDSVKHSKDKAANHLAAVLNDVSTKNSVLVMANQARTIDPDAALKQTRQQLQDRHKGLTQELQTHSSGLVPASDLVQIVHDVLKSNELLKLRELIVLPVEKITLASAGNNLENNLQGNASVYKYTVSIKLSGSYFEIVKYLQALEALAWNFYWQGIEYNVDVYPLAKVDITLFTLSVDKGNFGV